MDVVVFGAGSLGSVVGGLLASVHDVTLVGRSPHVDAVRERGLRLTGQVDRTVHPDAVTELGAASADLAVVTVKAYDTAAAAAALARCELGAALSLQNGMGNEETLGGALDCPVLAGTTTYGARFREPAVVECTGVGSVTLGPRPNASDGTDADVTHEVCEAFRSADVDARVEADMESRLWEKLAVNAGINPVTALAGVENGALVDGPAREVAEATAAEVATVARVAGVDLPEEAAREAVGAVAESTAANRSSMLQDVAAGRRTEVDAISGYVVDAAEGPVPVNGSLSALVRAWEAARGLR
jgi:2-dehydropantoate 2-reductase